MTSPRPIIMAPGVQFQEVDISQYIRELTDHVAAMLGPARKGEVNVDKLLTSLGDAIDECGFPGVDYPSIQALCEWFDAGGGRARHTRVANGDVAATATIDLIDGSDIEVDASSTGSYFNDGTAEVSYGGQLAQTATATHTFPIGDDTYAMSAQAGIPLVATTIIIKINSVKALTDNGSGVLVPETGFEDYGGTVNYLTGVITITTDDLVGAVTDATVEVTSSYWTTFNIQVKYTLKNSAGEVVRKPYLLESHKNLTLANMVERLAISRFMSITEAFTDFPVSGSYTFSGGDDGRTDLVAADYIGNTIDPTAPTGLQIYANPDTLDINLLAIPRASQNLSIRQAMIQVVEVDRQDTLAIIDPPPSLSVQSVIDWANGDGAYSSYDTIDSSYAALYYPYVKRYNTHTAEEEWAPPSAFALGAFARSRTWEAPAGPLRGKLGNIIDVEVRLNPRDREFLGENRINPISDLNGIGTMVLGQYTATISSSSLDRIAARMMLMRIEKAVTTALYPLLFQPNTPRTWNQANMIIQPYLDNLVHLERLYKGEFICDRTTNTDQVINNNIMAATCVLQLLKYAEIIIVTFLVTSLGAQITEELVSSYNPV